MTEWKTPDQDASLKSILGARFRANSDYELIPYERLEPEERTRLEEQRRDPSFFGVLRPRPESGLRLKSACRDTSLLFYALQAPGPLPAFAAADGSAAVNRNIAQLVLDGVLAVELGSTFVTGPRALPLMTAGEGAGRGADAAGAGQPAPRLARLSEEAVRHAAALRVDDAGRLSSRLYFYNRIPVSRRWVQLFPGAEAAARRLGLDGATGLPGTEWQPMKAEPPNDGWLAWRRRTPRTAPQAAAGDGLYKLYLSPHPGQLRDALEVFLPAITEAGAVNFKTGKNAPGLLRPDKIVAYFLSRGEMFDAARRAGAALSQCPAQGVPFTAPIDEAGLLSWGIDPPAGEQPVAAERRESWRLWVTNRLAVHLLAARAAPGGGVDAVRFALERMRLEQVDTVTWTPAAGIFGAAAAAGN